MRRASPLIGAVRFLIAAPLMLFGLSATLIRADKDLMGARLQTPLPPNIEFHSNIVYHAVGTTNLNLDLARPLGRGPFPALVVIHGLDSSKAGRTPFVPWIIEAATKGYAAVAISYRSKPEDGYLAPVHDARAAVRWLRANAVTYGINKDLIAALGFSGGGTIACLLGMASPQDDLEEPGAAGNSQVQAVVSYFPITDWKKLHSYCSEPAKKDAPSYLGMQRNWVKVMMEKSLGGPPAKVGANYIKASPITYVRKGAAPLLLIQGSNDTVVPPDQAQSLKHEMDKVGANVQLVTFDRAPHSFDSCGDPNAPLAAAAAWVHLETHLKRDSRNSSVAQTNPK